jgi:peptidoglycan/xylan/chitin deacetylase (PgdA/CDA1 family)
VTRVCAAAALLLSSCATLPPAQPPLEIAITVDDLPVHQPFPPGVTANQVNDQMIAALRAANVPAIGFVNGVGTEQFPESMQALKDWRAAGFPLGNHTWTHPHLSEMTIEQFEAEVAKGEPLLTELNGNEDWRWFRYPFLDEGKDAAQRVAARQVLAKHGYRIADVKMSFSDWAFTGAWARCSAAHDQNALQRLEQLYMESAKANLAVARETAHKLYGRDIPYVLLMHVSAMSAHMMPRVVDLYRKSGFRLVTIAEAERDPVYRAAIDLSLSPAPSDAERAKAKGVALSQAPDVIAPLAQMCSA